MKGFRVCTRGKKVRSEVVQSTQRLIPRRSRRRTSLPFQPQKHLLKPSQIHSPRPSPSISFTLAILQLYQRRNPFPRSPLCEPSRHLREIFRFSVFILSDTAFFFVGVVFVEGVYGTFGGGHGFETFGFGTFVSDRYFSFLLGAPVSAMLRWRLVECSACKEKSGY